MRKKVKKKLPSKKKDLPPKRKLFIDYYLADENLNASQAAIKAGYAPETAYSEASRLLRNVEVRDEIDKRMEERRALVRVDEVFVLKKLARIARADIQDAFNPDGSLRPIREIPEDVRLCIQSVEVDELFGPKEDGPGKEQIGYTRKVKFWSKDGSLKLLAQHLGMLVQKIQVTSDLESLLADDDDA